MLGLPHSISCLHTAPLQCPSVSGCGSHQEQTRWASILRAATHHQNSLFPITTFPHASMPLLKLFFSPSIPVIVHCLVALWCEDLPESGAFLAAAYSLKKKLSNRGTSRGIMGKRWAVAHNVIPTFPLLSFFIHFKPFLFALMFNHLTLIY